LVLIGESRTGKTEWARSLGCHMYFNHLMDLKRWNSGARYIIFDDIEFKFIPARKAFFGSQKTFTLTDKYMHKKTVIWGKPMIFICNPDMDPTKDDEWVEFYNQNSCIVKLNKPLF